MLGIPSVLWGGDTSSIAELVQSVLRVLLSTQGAVEYCGGAFSSVEVISSTVLMISHTVGLSALKNFYLDGFTVATVTSCAV